MDRPYTNEMGEMEIVLRSGNHIGLNLAVNPLPHNAAF